MARWADATQYQRDVIGYPWGRCGWILNNIRTIVMVTRMTRILSLSALLMITATVAQAACYADYKAKRDDPLRLHYGVAEITGACTVAGARGELAPRLANHNWELLSVEGVFDDAGLEEKQDSAGEFYLRY